MTSQTDRPGVSQTRSPLGVRYVSPELMPQGNVSSYALRQTSAGPFGSAPLLIAFTNPQQPRYGTGLTSITLPTVSVLLPGQGPIDRGY
jgi:hypothetical protein